jgi:hypothetical protein
MQVEVWDALARPVLLHGVELWGAYPPASGAPGDGRRRVDSSYTSFLRGLLATRAATPELVVMAETGRFPLALFIARQVYATWRRLHALDDDDRWVVRAALRDSEALAAEGGSSWAGAVREYNSPNLSGRAFRAHHRASARLVARPRRRPVPWLGRPRARDMRDLWRAHGRARA